MSDIEDEVTFPRSKRASRLPSQPTPPVSVQLRPLDLERRKTLSLSRLLLLSCPPPSAMHFKWEEHSALGSKLKMNFPAELGEGVGHIRDGGQLK